MNSSLKPLVNRLSSLPEDAQVRALGAISHALKRVDRELLNAFKKAYSDLRINNPHLIRLIELTAEKERVVIEYPLLSKLDAARLLLRSDDDSNKTKWIDRKVKNKDTFLVSIGENKPKVPAFTINENRFIPVVKEILTEFDELDGQSIYFWFTRSYSVLGNKTPADVLMDASTHDILIDLAAQEVAYARGDVAL